jgi:hypothetical protein
MSGATAKERPRTTFCWFPPERLTIGESSERVRTANRRTVSAASARSWKTLMNPRRASRGIQAAERFWRTLRVGKSAARFRSSGM